MEEILGYIAAIFIGLSLGLLGGGGSILAVPIFVYLFQIDEILATSYSLFVVGLTSLIGAFLQFKNKNINFKVVASFGLPALAAILLVRKYVIPLIPYQLFEIGTFSLNKNMAILLLFAVLMIVAAFSMIKGRKEVDVTSEKPKTILLVIFGFIVGILTGTVGAGGGFLIIPALVYFAKLNMKTAIGTSLAIITINSLIGFLGDISSFQMDWSFLLVIASLALIGIFIGTYIASFIPGKKLKPIFGYFVLLIGAYIIYKEIFLGA